LLRGDDEVAAIPARLRLALAHPHLVEALAAIKLEDQGFFAVGQRAGNGKVAAGLLDDELARRATAAASAATPAAAASGRRRVALGFVERPGPRKIRFLCERHDRHRQSQRCAKY